jgi:hypothetical protein
VVDCATERCGRRHASSSALDRMMCRTDNRRIASYGVTGCEIMCDDAGALSFGSNFTKDIPTPFCDAAPPPPIPLADHRESLIALPCIHPADAPIHAIDACLSRPIGDRVRWIGLTFARQRTGPRASGASIFGGVRHELSDVPIAWERALGWIPTFTCTIADS